MQAVDKWLWGELAGWFGAEIKLCVVSMWMEAKTVVVDDLTKGEHVDGEESKNRALMNTMVDWGRGWSWSL